MKTRKIGISLLSLCLVAALAIVGFAAEGDTAAATDTAATGLMANDSAGSQSLFASVGAARTAAGLGDMTYDTGLEKMAFAYAEELAKAGSDFRKTTDYLTLPSGERVVSLAAATGYGPIRDFYYYVWQNPAPGGGDKAAFVEATDLFGTAAAGNYGKIGIACATASDGSYSAVVMMFCNPPAAASAVTPAPGTPPAAESEPAVPAEPAAPSEPAAEASSAPSGT